MLNNIKHILLCLLVVLFASGWFGKSQKDIAGVYETKEIKEPINTYVHRSKKWILDLSESGNFTLIKEVFLIPIQDKKYSPIPEKGVNISGKWRLADDTISLKWKTFRAPQKDVKTQYDNLITGQINCSLSAEVQTSGNLVMGELSLTKYKDPGLVINPYDQPSPPMPPRRLAPPKSKLLSVCPRHACAQVFASSATG